MIIHLFAEVICRCTCGKHFDRNTPVDEMALHVMQDRPNRAHIEKLLICTVGTEPKTPAQAAAELGVPEGMVAFDVAADGLVYLRKPTWRRWESF